MTHFQELFIKNLRFYRKKRRLSQLKFSEMVNISPNYLNAVENGKNFPSPEVIQNMVQKLNIMPFQLFLEKQENYGKEENLVLIEDLYKLVRYFTTEIDLFIEKMTKNH
ncbi:MAG: helix-turn-helix domain-containing protein [Treponema sp.]|jgi:transcriptional regulator with XRE-family HTH domain|nr:helix-turn-helix domain-containing protein [Treponema sp.]